MIKISLKKILCQLSQKKLYEKTFQSIYIVDFSLLDRVPLFKDEFKVIGIWYSYSGKRWICHTELSTEQFKKMITKNIDHKDLKKVKFYLDYLPFSITNEIPF
ncbi:DUF3884 family protein [Staphylococcus pseudintermedius]|uniref:DUF3884 family protein n=1 Tax=Staphylococcus pseudintermedius TaxID=283734 RepID=UPI0028882168|nr:DUF3884 family protein [Staphylococcus pseudintermedius]MDT0945053.1 DUF3884 family protein [Staphylococcus pseudintermedius]